MNFKRIHPQQDNFQNSENQFGKILDDNLSDYQCFRKRIKKDNCGYHQRETEQDATINNQIGQNDQNSEINNFYEQEFENLRACSFKTISKIGHDKLGAVNKNQLGQFQGNFSSANRKKRQSLIHLSEQKSKNRNLIGKNNAKNCEQQMLRFGSMNEISKLQKKNSMDSIRLNGLVDRMRKRQSSISGVGSGSLNSINTHMMNQIMDFAINDENELDQLYLNKMIETALIKNVKFCSNLLVKFSQRKNQQKFYSNIIMYKILDFDGFSITGLYGQVQKIRINFTKIITNKQFEKKFVFQPQPNSNIEKVSKQQIIKQHGVQFQGNFYDFETQEYQEIKFYLNEVKDNIKQQSLNNDEIENIQTFENWMIPQQNFDCNFAFGNFASSSNKYDR